MPYVTVIRRLIIGLVRGGNNTPSDQVLSTENGVDLMTESSLNLFITE